MPDREAVIDRRRVGRFLILAGVLAWAPYAFLRYLMGVTVPLWPFLTLRSEWSLN